MPTPELWLEYQQIHTASPESQGADKVDFFARNSSAITKHNSHPSPEVAIIVPAYNEGVLIGRTLAGLNNALTQTNKVVEVIIVDNSSTDETGEIAQFFGAKTVSEKTKGVGRARQTGLESVSNTVETILTTDADTLVSPTWISTHLLELSKPDTACTYGESERLPDFDISKAKRTLLTLYTSIAERRHAMRRSKGIHITGGANMAFRKKDAEQIGGYDSTCVNGEDWDLSSRLAILGDVTWIDSPVTVSARRLLMKGLLTSSAERIIEGVVDPLLKGEDTSTFSDYREGKAVEIYSQQR